MKILSHSLHGVNIIFVIRAGLLMPSNEKFMSLFQGEEAQGVQFIDNPVTQTKALSAPKIGFEIMLEGKRLRIEDRMQREPKDSPLIDRAFFVIEKLFGEEYGLFESFGFNFNIYYQTDSLIRMRDFYGALTSETQSLGSDILDFGWQWTLASDGGKQLNGYFLKVTAPLELALHHNAHYNEKEITKKNMNHYFETSYEATHEMVKTLRITS